MKTCYIISTGTSILRKIRDIQERRSPAGGNAPPILDFASFQDVPDEKMVRFFRSLDQETFQGLSAEIETLFRIRPLPPKDCPLYLIASDTDEGMLAAHLNRLALVHVAGFFEIAVERVPGMKLEAGEIAHRGTRNLLRIVAEIRAEHHDLPCVINVSGGWKPMSMLLAFAGMFMRLPVYYAAESSQVLQLPDIPLRYDPDLFEKLDIRILARLSEEKKLPRSLWNRLAKRQSELEQVKFLITDETAQDHVEASDFGLIALAAYLGEKRDRLTGLFKKEIFEQLVERILPATEKEQRRTPRESGPGYCLAFADMDNLKQFNTQYGHARTDEVIREVARCLEREITREPGGFVARRSGDEFWLLFEATEVQQAEAALQRVGGEIQKITLDGITMPIAASIAAVWLPPGKTIGWKQCEKHLETIHGKLKGTPSLKGGVQLTRL